MGLLNLKHRANQFKNIEPLAKEYNWLLDQSDNFEHLKILTKNFPNWSHDLNFEGITLNELINLTEHNKLLKWL